MDRSRRGERHEYCDRESDDDIHSSRGMREDRHRLRDRYPDDEEYGSRSAREERHRIRDRDLDDDVRGHRGMSDEPYSSRGRREERDRFRDRDTMDDRRGSRELMDDGYGPRETVEDARGSRRHPDAPRSRRKRHRDTGDERLRNTATEMRSRDMGDEVRSLGEDSEDLLEHRSADEGSRPDRSRAPIEDSAPKDEVQGSRAMGRQANRDRAVGDGVRQPQPDEDNGPPRKPARDRAIGDGVRQSQPEEDSGPPRKLARSSGFSAGNNLVVAYVEPKNDIGALPKKEKPSLDKLLNTPGALITFPDETLDGADIPGSRNQPARLTKMCMYWCATRCQRGRDCWFAHGPEELARGYRIHEDGGLNNTTTRLDFNRIDADASKVSSTVKVPNEQVKDLMTDTAKQIIMEVAGPSEVDWDAMGCKVTFWGTQQQTEKAAQLIKRVTTHCLWGVSRPKVEGLLKSRSNLSTARLTLSPMDPVLKTCAITLSSKSPQLTIGKAPENILVVNRPGISRNHAVVEFDASKGAVYIVDTSTNGTILNGKRLPKSGSAKVVLWHGDELLLAVDNTGGISEFGYVVNLTLS